MMFYKTKKPDNATLAAPPERLFGTLVFGTVTGIVLVGGMVAWALTTHIDGAVIAPAAIEAEGSRKTVQHLEGGIVAGIAVKDGDLVQPGQTLIQLDETVVKSELAIVLDRLEGLSVRRARLEATLKGEDSFALPTSVQIQADEADLAAVIANERRLLASDAEAQRAGADLTARRVAALQAQVDGLVRQIHSWNEELTLVREANGNLSRLLEQQLVPAQQVLTLRRDIAQLEGGVSDAQSQIASLEARILETLAQQAQSLAAERSAAAEQLSQVQAEMQSLIEQSEILSNRLTRSVLKAPYAGYVLNLAVKTEGAVIAPGAPIMEIVPADDRLILNARVDATEIERISLDQTARIRLIALNQNATPEFSGHVIGVSADALTDQASGQAYYRVKVDLNPDEFASLEPGLLKPGMPAEVLVSTGDRLAASYFLRPLRNAYERSFRDE